MALKLWHGGGGAGSFREVASTNGLRTCDSDFDSDTYSGIDSGIDSYNDGTISHFFDEINTSHEIWEL